MVDATGQFPDGDGFADVVELKDRLLERKSQFARCLTEKLLIYSTGRKLSPLDRPHVDRIVRDLEAKGWGFRDLLLLVVESKPFLQLALAVIDLVAPMRRIRGAFGLAFRVGTLDPHLDFPIFS